jgi:hypothetical protein
MCSSGCSEGKDIMKKILNILSSLIFLVLASCSPKGENLYLQGVEQKNFQIEDPNAVYFDPAVDILFVVDNSGSMDTHQQNLIKNIDLFTNAFLNNSVLDYNIGVISTDMELGGADTDGKLVGVGGSNIVSRNTPNAINVLKNNLDLGTYGSSSEMVFDPVYAALSKHVNNANKGFYRSNATLVTIFVTDAEDQSMIMSPTKLQTFLLSLKNGDASKIISLGVIVPSGVNNCDRDAGADPVDIETFLNFFPLKTQTNILNLCSPTYGSELSALASNIVNQIGSVIYLNKLPKAGTLKVTYGAIDLPLDYKKGFSYDAARNAVILGRDIDWRSQPSGSRIKVFYDAVKFD